MPRIMLALSIKAYRLDISNYCPESPKMILVTSSYPISYLRKCLFDCPEESEVCANTLEPRLKKN